MLSNAINKQICRKHLFAILNSMFCQKKKKIIKTSFSFFCKDVAEQICWCSLLLFKASCWSYSRKNTDSSKSGRKIFKFILSLRKLKKNRRKCKIILSLQFCFHSLFSFFLSLSFLSLFLSLCCCYCRTIARGNAKQQGKKKHKKKSRRWKLFLCRHLPSESYRLNFFLENKLKVIIRQNIDRGVKIL